MKKTYSLVKRKLAFLLSLTLVLSYILEINVQAASYGTNLVVNGDGSLSGNETDYTRWTATSTTEEEQWCVVVPADLDSINSFNGGNVFDYYPILNLNSTGNLMQTIDVTGNALIKRKLFYQPIMM